jgi:hypothetical protein
VIDKVECRPHNKRGSTHLKGVWEHSFNEINYIFSCLKRYNDDAARNGCMLPPDIMHDTCNTAHNPAIHKMMVHCKQTHNILPIHSKTQ